MVNFCGNRQAVFQSGHNPLLLLIENTRVQVPASLSVLAISSVYFHSSGGHAVMLQCNFILHIPHSLIPIPVL